MKDRITKTTSAPPNCTTPLPTLIAPANNTRIATT